MGTTLRQRWGVLSDCLVLAVPIAATVVNYWAGSPLPSVLAILASITFSVASFVIAWNRRATIGDRFLLRFAVALGPVAGLSAVQYFTRELTPDSFPYSHLPQFWVAGHLLVAAAALAATIPGRRAPGAGLVLLGTGMFAAVAPLAIFADVVPIVAEDEWAEVVAVVALGAALVSYASSQGRGNRTRAIVIMALVAWMLHTIAGPTTVVGALLDYLAPYLVLAAVIRSGGSSAQAEYYRLLADEAQESRNLADAALKAASADIWQWDVASGEIRLARNFHASLGYQAEEVPSDVQDAIDFLVHPGDAYRLRRDMDAVAVGEVERLNLELRLRAKSAGWRWAMARGVVVEKDDLGRPVTVLGTTVDITDRKVFEDALRSSEERFRAIFNSVDDLIFLHDPETGAILDCNDRACELYGYDRDEMRQVTVEQLSSGEPPFTQQQAMEIFGASLLGTPQRREWRARHQSGYLFWVDIRVRAAAIGGQQIILVTGRDVTERRQAAEKLAWDSMVSTTFAELGKHLLVPKGGDATTRALEAAARDLTESPMAVVAPDDPGLKNAIADKLCGCPATEQCPIAVDMLGFSRFSVRNTLDCPRCQQASCGRYLAAPAMIGSRFLGMVAVAGAAREYSEDEQKVIARLADHYALFLHREEQEAVLRASEERFRSMTTAAHDAVVVLDDQGCVTFWNPAAEAIFGFSEHEVLGRPIHPLVMPDPAIETYERNYSVFAASGQGPAVGRRLELLARRKDGRTFPVELSVAAFRFDKRWHAVGIVHDITDRREMQQQLGQLQKMEALGNLAGGIAHDFNNLLLPIIMFSEMAIEDLPPGSPTAEMLRKVVGAGERAKELVTKILTFSRKTETSRVRCNVLAVVKEALEFVKATLPAAIELRLDMEDVGDSLIDRSQIQTVILNLASNSVDAIDGGTGWISVTLSRLTATESMAAGVLNLTVGRDYALLRFKDSGCGMPPDVVQRMFDPFYTTKPAGQGTGLGMPMVHSIVRNHAGSIRVHSRVGKGTTIEIYLPLEQ